MNKRKYPFGKFIIFSGVGMFLMICYGIFFFEYSMRVFGEKVGPYVMLVFCGILTLILSDLDNKLDSKITGRVGVGGWVATLILLFWYYNSQ